MNLIKKDKINKINAYLLIVLAFILPISVAATNLLIACIVLLWLGRGTFKDDYNELKTNKVVIAVVVFYSLHVLGLLWTEDLEWGIHILKKETKFLVLPILMLFVRYEQIKYYIISFLLAMVLSVLLSYGIWFEFIINFKSATSLNPTPFMSHISYNPILALIIYILFNEILFNNISFNRKILYGLLIVLMSVNMFITGGRAGQVVYFLIIICILFQYFHKNKLKAFLLSILIIPTIFFLAYTSSTLFKKRVLEGIENIENYSSNKNTSMGERLNFLLNSFNIIEKSPIFGIGTGDFKNEYMLINKSEVAHLSDTTHPHNMYLLVTTQLGIIGLISLLSIFYFQIIIALNESNKYLKNLKLFLPFLFIFIMFSDSYLLGHYTTMLFLFFSSFLYKEYNRKVIVKSF